MLPGRVRNGLRIAGPPALLVALTAGALAALAHLRAASAGPAPSGAEALLAAKVTRQARALLDSEQDWRQQTCDFRLLPPPAAVVTILPPAPTVIAPVAPPPPPVYVLTGVLSSEGRRIARINDRLYTAGDAVSPGMRLETIGADHVVLVDTQSMRRVVRLNRGH